MSLTGFLCSLCLRCSFFFFFLCLLLLASSDSEDESESSESELLANFFFFTCFFFRFFVFFLFLDRTGDESVDELELLELLIESSDSLSLGNFLISSSSLLSKFSSLTLRSGSRRRFLRSFFSVSFSFGFNFFTTSSLFFCWSNFFSSSRREGRLEVVLSVLAIRSFFNESLRVFEDALTFLGGGSGTISVECTRTGDLEREDFRFSFLDFLSLAEIRFAPSLLLFLSSNKSDGIVICIE
ncbi:hypothetical protein AGLY_011350 [Aphis glycines]|uniref:EF-hand domain-containing protein n=1 Tax=Aphis glycines TaxID=307491 RepID=A0A6G0TDS8_APHGL|nr:hypothetical protein AGLY_011350 [Aphis glycines]